jgi:O-antigen/teichoic acid export membrane protein
MAITQTLSALVLFFAKVILVFAKAPLYMFVVVSAVDLIGSGIIFSIYFLRYKEWRDAFAQYTFPPFARVFSFLYSIRLSIAALIFWQLLQRVDQLILATFSNAYTLGIYSAAVKVAEVPNFLAGILSAALISRMAYVATNNDEDSKHKLNRIMLSYFIVGTVIALGFVILSPLAVHILYGSKFIESTNVLRVYALSIPGMFMNYFFLSMYGARDKQQYQIFIFAAAVFINVVLVYTLTPLFGLVGTAFATVVAYTASAIGFYSMLEYKNK